MPAPTRGVHSTHGTFSGACHTMWGGTLVTVEHTVMLILLESTKIRQELFQAVSCH